MKAVGSNVVIKPTKEVEIVAGGMETSASDRKKIRYKKAKVISVGEEVTRVLENDLIMYDSASGHTALIDGEQYTVIQHRDIAMIL